MDGDRREPPRRDVPAYGEQHSKPDDERSGQEDRASRPEDDRDPVRDRRRRNLGFVIGGIVALVLVAGGAMYWLHARHYESTDDAFIDGNTTQMAPQVAGRVTTLQFTDNQHVEAGQKLVLIDPRDFQARLDQAKAQLANAGAQLAQANAQVVVRQADLDQAQANVRVAQAEQVQAQKDYGRYTSINPHAITQLQIDSSTASLRSANAKLDGVNQAVGGAHAQLLTAQAQVLAATASEQQARANVDAAALQLSYCTITAPISGRITHRTVNVGDYVNPGQAMFAIVQDGLWVTANFKETELDLMRPGQPVELEIDAFPDASFHGHVDSFQAGTGSAFSVLPAENATGNYVKVVQRVPVKILFDGDGPNQRRLAPGMSVVPTVTVR